MSKISITNGKITSIEPYGNGVLLETSPDAVVIVDGATPQADAQQPVSADNRKPVGPRDQFTGPWRPGDRQPTDMEQMMKPEWFRDLPDGRSGTDEPGGGGPSATVGFVLGGVVKIGYPQGNQKQTRVTGCVPGLVAYDIGPVLLGKGLGTARVSIAQESSGDAAGRFNVATEPGVDSGASVLAEYEGNMPVFNIDVTADMPKLYVNARYTSVSANQLVQVEAHDR